MNLLTATAVVMCCHLQDKTDLEQAAVLQNASNDLPDYMALQLRRQ
jgi:hypothetical protein